MRGSGRGPGKTGRILTKREEKGAGAKSMAVINAELALRDPGRGEEVGGQQRKDEIGDTELMSAEKRRMRKT